MSPRAVNVDQGCRTLRSGNTVDHELSASRCTLILTLTGSQFVYILPVTPPVLLQRLCSRHTNSELPETRGATLGIFLSPYVGMSMMRVAWCPLFTPRSTSKALPLQASRLHAHDDDVELKIRVVCVEHSMVADDANESEHTSSWQEPMTSWNTVGM